ncbi:MAG: hypothetical protein K2X99_13485, partial [Gemmatimonadaceae bacterium]|nr:hypothetical protein [Gemmatimonadaceae bacterium]
TFPGLSINRAGVNYALGASSTGLTNGGSTTFDVTAGAASRTVLSSGDGQSGPSGSALADEVGVFVSDELGNPIANVPVTFTPASGHGTASPSVTPTNAQGIAKTRWTLAGAAGAKSMTITGPGAPVTATATAVGVVSGGPTRVFFALDNTAIGRSAFSAITVFLNAPAVAPTTVTLGLLDARSQWSSVSLTFLAGASSAIASWRGTGSGTTSGTVTAPGLNGDTITASIATENMWLMTGYMSFAVGDTIENVVTLSAPAPAGGLIITPDATVAGRVLFLPSAGDGYGAGDPYSGYDIRANTMFAPATITVKAGETRGYFKVVGLSAGATAITLSATDFISATGNVNVSAMGLTTYGDTMVAAVGASTQREWYFSSSSARTRTVTYTSLDPGIVAITGPASVVRDHYFYASVRGIAPGVGRVIVSSPGGGVDTLTVVVAQPKLRFQMFCITYSCYTPRNFSMYAGEEREGRLLLVDSVAQSVTAETPVTVTLVSTDATSAIPTVSTVTIGAGQNQATFGVRALAMGTPWLFASAPGVRSDTSQGSIAGPIVQLSGVGDVGVGQLRTFIVDGVRPAPDATTVTLTSSNPAVVDVPPVVTLSAGSSSVGGIRLIGRTPGTATITASIPGVGSATSGLLRVSPTKLVISCWSNCSPATGGSSGSWRVQVRDSLGVARGVVGNLALSFSVSDTTKLQVNSATTTIYEGNLDGFVSAAPRAAGTVRLRVSAPGYAPESISVTVPAGVATSKIEFALGPTARVGRAQRIPNAYLYRSGPDNLARTVTLTKLGSATTLSTTTLAFAANSYYTANFRIDAVANGVDTIIATAPGLIPDTVVVRISSPRFAVSGFPTSSVVGYPYASANIALADSTFTTNSASNRTIVFISSSDTNVVKPVQAADTIETDDYLASIPLQYRGPGTATITVSTASGYATYVSPTITVAAQQLTLSYSSITLGMRQQTHSYEGYVYSSYPVLQPIWVRLTRSAPGLISVPDSVRFDTGDSYAYFTIAALDTVGGLRLTANAPGFNSDQLDVYVTKPAAIICCSTSAALGRGAISQTLYLGTTGGYEHASSVPLTFSISSSSPSAAMPVTSTVTIPVGEQEGEIDLALIGQGTTTLSATDSRSTFARYLDASSTLRVNPSALSVTSILTLGPNIETELNLYADNRTAPLTVNWAKSGAGATTLASAGSFVLAANVSYHTPLTIRSTATIGADTIIFTAPNWTPDTLVVRTGTGTFYLGYIPNTLTSGAETSFYLSAGSPSGYTSYDDQVNALPITLTCTSGCSWVNPATAAVVSSITIPAGSNYVSVALRGNSPGLATYTISAPGYASVSRTMSVLPASP